MTAYVKMLQLLGAFVPRPPTGALPMDPIGGLLGSPLSLLNFDPQQKFIKSSTGDNEHT